MQVLKLEGLSLLQVEELIDVPHVLLIQLVVIGKGHLPLTPRNVVRQVPIHSVVRLLDLLLCLRLVDHLLTFLINVERL